MSVGGEQSQEIWQSRSVDVSENDNQTIGQHLDCQSRKQHVCQIRWTNCGDKLRRDCSASGGVRLIIEKDGRIHLYGTDIAVSGIADIAVKGAKVKVNPSAAGSQNTEVLYWKAKT